MIRKPFQKIDTTDAPQAIGPYSQAIATEEFLFVSGQIAIDPLTGKIEKEGIEDQTRQVFVNLGAILKEARLNFDDVVRTDVFLQNMDDFGLMNQVYSEFFNADIKPARQAVEVSRLPMNARIEISCIAIRSKK